MVPEGAAMAVPGTEEEEEEEEEGNEERGGTGLKNTERFLLFISRDGPAAALFDRRGGRTWPRCAPHGGTLVVQKWASTHVH